jgi:hypothetical protein
MLQKTMNIFANLPNQVLPAEIFDTLCSGQNFKLERIESPPLTL